MLCDMTWLFRSRQGYSMNSRISIASFINISTSVSFRIFCTRKEENAVLDVECEEWIRILGLLRDLQCWDIMSRARPKLDTDNSKRKRLDVNEWASYFATRDSRAKTTFRVHLKFAEMKIHPRFSPRRLSGVRIFFFFSFYENAPSVLHAALHARLTLLDIMRARYRSSASNFHFCMRDRRDDTFVRTRGGGPLCRRLPFRIAPRSRFTERRNAAANYTWCYAPRRFISRTIDLIDDSQLDFFFHSLFI